MRARRAVASLFRLSALGPPCPPPRPPLSSRIIAPALLPRGRRPAHVCERRRRSRQADTRAHTHTPTPAVASVPGALAFPRVRGEKGGRGPGRGLARSAAADALASVLRLRSAAGADSPAPDVLASVLRLRGAGPKGKKGAGPKGKKVSKPSVSLNFATSLAAGKPEASGQEKDKEAETGEESRDKGALDMSEIKASLSRLDDGLPVVTGVLATHEGSRDIKIESFTLEVCC